MFQGFDSVTRNVHLQARRLQNLAQGVANALVVVDHQHARFQHESPMGWLPCQAQTFLMAAMVRMIATSFPARLSRY
jgi:hypothetical protein